MRPEKHCSYWGFLLAAITLERWKAAELRFVSVDAFQIAVKSNFARSARKILASSTVSQELRTKCLYDVAREHTELLYTISIASP